VTVGDDGCCDNIDIRLWKDRRVWFGEADGVVSMDEMEGRWKEGVMHDMSCLLRSGCLPSSSSSSTFFFFDDWCLFCSHGTTATGGRDWLPEVVRTQLCRRWDRNGPALMVMALALALEGDGNDDGG